jgi:hypothetical protein
MTDISSINPVNDDSIRHYTPTTEEVRDKFSFLYPAFEGQFDRWLAEVKAEAWEEGFDAGERDVFEHDERDEWGKEHTCIQNPYRQGETE